jgi:hypothetical protein
MATPQHSNKRTRIRIYYHVLIYLQSNLPVLPSSMPPANPPVCVSKSHPVLASIFASRTCSVSAPRTYSIFGRCRAALDPRRPRPHLRRFWPQTLHALPEPDPVPGKRVIFISLLTNALQLLCFDILNKNTGGWGVRHSENERTLGRRPHHCFPRSLLKPPTHRCCRYKSGNIFTSNLSAAHNV